jgi:uncharacterized membrane protein YqjE
MTDESPRGVLGSLRGLLVAGIAIARNRLELLATEIQEEKVRILGLLLYGIAALMLLVSGMVFLAIFLTVLFWDGNRLLALGIFTAIFILSGVIAAVVARGYARSASALFSASIAELARDKEAAQGVSQADKQ